MSMSVFLSVLMTACDESREVQLPAAVEAGNLQPAEQEQQSTGAADGTLGSFLERNFGFYTEMDAYNRPVWADDRTLVYLTGKDSEDGMRHLYTIYRYDIETNEKVPLWEEESPYSPSLLDYRPSDHALLFSVPLDRSRQLLQLDVTSGELAKYPQMKHGEWTIELRPDGIWGENAAAGRNVQWVKGTYEPELYFLNNNKTFVFLEKTGKFFADGTGIERQLRKVDMETGKITTLFPEQPQWNILGWAKEGEVLLVDVAFNEGADHNYIYPMLMDLVQETSRPLISGQEYGSYYDAAFSAKASLFAANSDGYRYVFDMQGELIAKQAWIGEFQGMEAFSPDGRRSAFSSGTFQEGRVFVSDPQGKHIRAVTPDSMPVSGLIWSPSGKRLLVQLDGPIAGIIDISN